MGAWEAVDSLARDLDCVRAPHQDHKGSRVQVITIAARKGGVGKTTLAMHLSVLASDPDKPALLLDTDPLRSLAWWHRLREADVPNLIEADARELPELVAAAKQEGISRIIIDTPPHA